jgi:hypothetical protein
MSPLGLGHRSLRLERSIKYPYRLGRYCVLELRDVDGG